MGVISSGHEPHRLLDQLVRQRLAFQEGFDALPRNGPGRHRPKGDAVMVAGQREHGDAGLGEVLALVAAQLDEAGAVLLLGQRHRDSRRDLAALQDGLARPQEPLAQWHLPLARRAGHQDGRIVDQQHGAAIAAGHSRAEIADHRGPVPNAHRRHPARHLTNQGELPGDDRRVPQVTEGDEGADGQDCRS